MDKLKGHGFRTVPSIFPNAAIAAPPRQSVSLS